ncbi:MAG: HAD-IA family hydrolase [Acidobacteria bacterium]|nr:HAD-IA family hydrolase [Acidobacteriota bacterium]MCA1611229.1 HAD-IA family hydrolase [Acidobacteriota bacterium]
MIRAVLFDAGLTLVHPSPPVERVYARELAADGARFTLEELDAALTKTWEEVHAEGGANRYAGVRGEGAFWAAFVDRVRRRLDGGSISQACFGRLTAHFREASSWAVYPDVEETLAGLERRGLALAIVSNWDSSLPPLLEALSLAPRFRAVAVSAIEETGKPDPEIFHRVCARLGLEPPECLHVGDSRREDFEGARAAGLRGVLLDRNGRHPDLGAEDRIGSLTELAALVERGGR